MGQTRQRSQSRQDDTPTEEEIAEAIALILAGGVAVAAANPTPAITSALLLIAPAGIAGAATTAVIGEAARLVVTDPPPAPKSSRTARRMTEVDNLLRRGHYGINAVKRLGSAYLDDEADFSKALDRERSYFGLHKEASSRRIKAADLNDTAEDNFGPRLGWYSVMDDSTTPECASANRHNFDIDNPPRIGLPGTLHGGTCRCSPGAPFPGAPLLR